MGRSISEQKQQQAQDKGEWVKVSVGVAAAIAKHIMEAGVALKHKKRNMEKKICFASHVFRKKQVRGLACENQKSLKLNFNLCCTSVNADGHCS